MAYDRGQTANPLRRLRGTVMEHKDTPPQLRKHLYQTIDDYLDICHDYFTQQAASAAIMARWMAMKCEAEMLRLPATTQAFKSASLCFQKHTALANNCFRLAKSGSNGHKTRMKPPTRSSTQSPDTDAS